MIRRWGLCTGVDRMISTTLHHLIEQRLTSAREISELAGVSSSTVYRWIAGESQPDFNSIRLLLRHMQSPEAQEALLSAFTAGTPWQFVHSEQDLDVNDDGEVNADDALDASIASMKAAAGSLEKVRAAARDGALNSEQTLRLLASLNQAVGHATLTQRILVELSEQQQRRNLKLAR